MQQLSARGAAFVMKHEGFVSHYYKDAIGVGTIGIGFTWRSTSFRKWWEKNRPGQTFGPGSRMSREEAQDALMFLCNEEYGKAVATFLKKAVAQHVFDGMTSPVFNLGPGSLKWKWAAAAKRGDYAECARLLRGTGTTAGGRTLAGLVRRRKEEANLIQYGNYAGAAPADVSAADDGLLKYGESGKEIAQLIRDLEELGYYEGPLDDKFGPGTLEAVKDFQRDKSLSPDGVVGDATMGAIRKALDEMRNGVEPPHPIDDKKPDPMADGLLVKGEEGEPVAQLIRDLHELGYYEGKLDDTFGHGTLSAVLEFQEDYGLTRDGIVGKNTFAALEAALEAALKEHRAKGKVITAARVTTVSSSALATAITMTQGGYPMVKALIGGIAVGLALFVVFWLIRHRK